MLRFHLPVHPALKYEAGRPYGPTVLQTGKAKDYRVTLVIESGEVKMISFPAKEKVQRVCLQCDKD
jgi:hypothetical protein